MKKDFFDECYSDAHKEMPEPQFKATFCEACRNVSCSRSKINRSLWADRISSQEDRLLINPRFSENVIQDVEFKDLAQKVLSLETWDVVPNKPEGFVAPEPREPEIKARWQVEGDTPGNKYWVIQNDRNEFDCDCPAKKPCKHIMDIQKKLSNLHQPELIQIGNRSAPFVPKARNTQQPNDGIYIGQKPSSDAWDTPKPRKDRVLPVGGRVIMGGDKK